MYAQRLGAGRAGELNRFADARSRPVCRWRSARTRRSPNSGPWAAVRAAVHPSDPARRRSARGPRSPPTPARGWRAAGADRRGRARRPARRRRSRSGTAAGRDRGRRPWTPTRATGCRLPDCPEPLPVGHRAAGHRDPRRRPARADDRCGPRRRGPRSAILVPMRPPRDPAVPAALGRADRGRRRAARACWPSRGSGSGRSRSSASRCSRSRSTAGAPAPAPGSATCTAPRSCCRCVQLDRRLRRARCRG